MKAAILIEQNAPLVIDKVTLPDTLSFGQVLVKVHYTSICGSQIDEITGANGPDKYLPHLMGHEGVGTVLDMGPGVKTVKKDDTVVMHAIPSDGLQSETPVYYRGKQRVNAGWVTTFNECAVVSENRVVSIPKDFDLKLAPLFGCAITTAMGVINNEAKLRSGQSIVVYGCGSTGLNVVQAARMLTAYPIVAVDIIDARLTAAKKFGATHIINVVNCNDSTKKILEIVGDRGANIVINTTKNPRVIEEAYSITADDGKTILIGLPNKGETISYGLQKDFKKVLVGTFGGGTRPEIEIPQYIRLFNAGLMKLDGMITNEFSLDEINVAIDLTSKGEIGKCLIRMN
jgi:S-(hydroxymethyl)glutathione dehydrogenase / alcohol dehydrogenase